MGWIGTPGDISHYIMFIHLYGARRSLFLSGYTCTTIPQWAFGTTKGSARQPQAGHHHLGPRPLPSHPPALDPIDISLVYGVGGFFLLSSESFHFHSVGGFFLYLLIPLPCTLD